MREKNKNRVRKIILFKELFFFIIIEISYNHEGNDVLNFTNRNLKWRHDKTLLPSKMAIPPNISLVE